MTLRTIICAVLISITPLMAQAELMENTLCTADLRACISREPIELNITDPAPVTLMAHHSKKYKKKRKVNRYMPSTRPATGGRVFVFNPRRLSWGAYDASGHLINWGRASGGKSYCRDVRRSCLTPVGQFRVSHKGSSRCRSSKYPLGRGGAPMPYCMFFYRGYAIHGSPNVPDHNASHGCVRVLPSAAKWLHRNFIRSGTTVIVQPY